MADLGGEDIWKLKIKKYTADNDHTWPINVEAFYTKTLKFIFIGFIYILNG